MARARRRSAFVARTRHHVPYTLGETVTSLVAAGLRLEFLHESPWCPYRCWPFAETPPDGTARLREHDGSVPLAFSIPATKPERTAASR